MFKTRKKMQTLIDASRKSLANAEDEITQREKLIEMQRNEIHEWQKENKELRFDNEELSELVRIIKNLAESNSYNNEKNILNKIKELVNDFDSITNSKSHKYMNSCTNYSTR